MLSIAVAPGLPGSQNGNVIERCFVEVRRRTRPMAVFRNVESVDPIIYAVFSRFNQDWKSHTLNHLHKQLDVTQAVSKLI